jgi:PelA/Pel-15E family pectate lyase
MNPKPTMICVSFILALPVVEARISSKYTKHSVEWFQSEEGRRIADNVLSWQSPHGSWPKNGDTASRPYEGKKNKLEGTFDNWATTGELRFLARAFRATNEPRYKQAFLKGLDHILAAQYPIGGWPQFYPPGRDYPRHITYNDDAMIRVMMILRDVAGGQPPYEFVDESRRKKVADAVECGIKCILKTQIKQDGKLTAWCAQHDEKTLAPAWGRSYEPPSISGSESVDIIRFLMSIEEPTPEIVAAIEGSVAWFRSVAMKGVRLERVRRDDGRLERWLVPDPNAPPLWARFYELGTNRPLYLDRDSVFRYDFTEIGYERRSGYAYHGTWPASLIATEYPAWRRKHKLP